MPEGRKFSHISVNTAEDDDIVIEAGAYAKPAAEPGPQPEPEPAQPEPESDPEPRAAQAHSSEPEPQPRASADPEPRAASEQTPVEKPHSSDAPRDTYDQTLEDLERTPMPSMQRNVLIGLAIVVIASCVYYVVRFVL